MRTRHLAVLAVIAAFVAACDSGSNGAESAFDPSATPAKSATDLVAAPAQSATMSPFCLKLTTLEAADTASPFEPATPEELRKAVATTLAGFDGLSAAAPDDLKPDIATVVTSYRKIDEAYSADGYIFDKIAANEQTAAVIEGLSDLEPALDRLSGYAETACLQQS